MEPGKLCPAVCFREFSFVYWKATHDSHETSLIVLMNHNVSEFFVDNRYFQAGLVRNNKIHTFAL